MLARTTDHPLDALDAAIRRYTDAADRCYRVRTREGWEPVEHPCTACGATLLGGDPCECWHDMPADERLAFLADEVERIEREERDGAEWEGW